jgi:hypothetical protein
MIKYMLAGAAALLLQAVGPGTVPDAPRVAYAEGQVWQYRTRPQDAGSLVKIQKIETPSSGKLPGPIYHVTVVGVNFSGPRLFAGLLGHLPVSRETLDASVTQLAADQARPFPKADSGIEEWRRANGGVFTIPLAEIVTIAEGAIQGAPEPAAAPH